ncbi:hypothetical protein IJ670_00520 [bacterium]|nr:hypothetical protein [bacterium]
MTGDINTNYGLTGGVNPFESSSKKNISKEISTDIFNVLKQKLKNSETVSKDEVLASLNVADLTDEQRQEIDEILSTISYLDGNTDISREDIGMYELTYNSLSMADDSEFTNQDINDLAYVFNEFKAGNLTKDDVVAYLKNAGLDEQEALDLIDEVEAITPDDLKASGDKTMENFSISTTHKLDFVNDNLEVLAENFPNSVLIAEQAGNKSLSKNTTTLGQKTQQDYLDLYLGKDNGYTVNGDNSSIWFSKKVEGGTSCIRIVEDNEDGGKHKMITTFIPDDGTSATTSVYGLQKQDEALEYEPKTDAPVRGVKASVSLTGKETDEVDGKDDNTTEEQEDKRSTIPDFVIKGSDLYNAMVKSGNYDLDKWPTFDKKIGGRFFFYGGAYYAPNTQEEVKFNR